MTKSLRAGKVFVDWSQNNAVEDHDRAVLAARARASRRSPRRARWEELDDPDLRHLRYDEVLDTRCRRDGDLLAELDDAMRRCRTG